MKKILFIVLATTLSLAMSAQNNPILIEPTDSIWQHDPRSILEDIPAVSLDGTKLIIDYPSATVSQVIICQQNPSQVVYSDSFASSCQVIIDLEDENIGEGSYTLWLYAFGKWWRGEFVIEDN